MPGQSLDIENDKEDADWELDFAASATVLTTKVYASIASLSIPGVGEVGLFAAIAAFKTETTTAAILSRLNSLVYSIFISDAYSNCLASVILALVKCDSISEKTLFCLHHFEILKRLQVFLSRQQLLHDYPLLFN